MPSIPEDTPKSEHGDVQMSKAEQLYEDQWGAVIDHPESDAIEIRWYDTTRDMDGAQFNAFLTIFADYVESRERSRCLIDATNFRMDPSRFDTGWRDKNIIPKYNRGGVAKFAFHMPSGMPAIGRPPAVDGPANFPTAYFGTRSDALGWLAE